MTPFPTPIGVRGGRPSKGKTPRASGAPLLRGRGSGAGGYFLPRVVPLVEEPPTVTVMLAGAERLPAASTATAPSV